MRTNSGRSEKMIFQSALITADLIGEVTTRIQKQSGLPFESHGFLSAESASLQSEVWDEFDKLRTVCFRFVMNSLLEVRLYGEERIELIHNQFKNMLASARTLARDKVGGLLAELDALLAKLYEELLNSTMSRLPKTINGHGKGHFILEDVEIRRELSLEGGPELGLTKLLSLVAKGGISVTTKYRWVS